MAAFCVGGALESQAQTAPPNDNLTNAQGIVGISGSVQGTNLYATKETRETNLIAGVAVQSTIWYVWTAPVTAEMDLNTRNSTDPAGISLDTTLAVYRVKKTSGALAITNLSMVASNEDDPSGGVTSRVDFQAALGTTYYIQVGSLTNTGDGYGQGYPVLNWSQSLVAGGFGFSTSYYPMSSLENYLPDNDGSINPSIANSPPSLPGINVTWGQGEPNARITVTRTGGYTGRCEVTLIAVPGYYTNYYETNYMVTNLFMTNYTSNGVSSKNITSYTNLFMTNIASVNFFGNNWYGLWYLLPADSDVEVTQTNSTGTTRGLVYTNIESLTGLGLDEFFTNFTCSPSLNESSIVTNSDNTITVYTTNVYCSSSNAMKVVPAAYSGAQFAGGSVTLTFDDFQMSQDVYIQIYPLLNDASLGVADEYTPGPQDLGYASDPNYTYEGLNSVVQLSLTNLVLDSQEDPDIMAPTFATQSNSLVNVLNYWGDPYVTYSNTLPASMVMMNFERYTYRCDKDCGTAAVWVQRTVRGADATHFVHYTIDSLYLGDTVIDDNQFATVAGSDFAVPSDGQADYDFTLPTTSDWTGSYGTLTFPSLLLNAQAIYIPIANTGAVEFDQDIELQLFLFEGEWTAEEAMTPVSAMIGTIDTARLTINSDFDGSGAQPGGAVDKNYNIDAYNISQPPENLVPGANATVSAVAIDASGRAVIGGDFNAYNTTPVNYLARLKANGFIDNTFTTGVGRGPNNFVNAIVIDSSGRIIIGGNFTSVNAGNAFYIARLNASGSLDTTFATGYGFNGYVNALALDASGNILVGGNFTSFNKTNCNHIARLLTNGVMDTSFLPSSGVGVTNGTDQSVYAVAVDGAGNVILGGAFATVNGTNWNGIARLLPTGALDTSFNPGLGADGDVLALAVQPDNSIILGGAFQNFNLISRNSIARLTSGGALDTSFAPGSGFDDIVYSLALQPDGNILVGGQFTMYNTTRRVGLARLLGGQGSQAGEGGWLDTSFMDTAYNQFAGVINHYYNSNAYNINDFPLPWNSRNQVLAMALQSDGNVVIGGSFSRVGGGFTRDDVRTRMNVARIIGQATTGPEEGGIGNCPGNLGMTQSPYTVDDTGRYLFVTLNRANGSLGPVMATLGTNMLSPSSSSATAADFGLLGTGIGETLSLFDTVWDIEEAWGTFVGPANYGWRMSDGEYGYNYDARPDITGAEFLYLSINNNTNTTASVLYANLNLLNLNANNLLSLGGVPIPFGPALGQYSAQLDIINDNVNFSAGTIGFGATNYNVLESAGTVTVPLLRTNGVYGTVSVAVNALNGTAINGTDYGWTTKTVQFKNGVTSNSVTIPIVDHSTQQTNKFFKLFLSSPTGGARLDTSVPPLVSSNTVVTIIDDHFQPGYLSFSSPAYSVLKPGQATISVIRTGAALGQVTVQAGTSDGTAINSVNYVGVTNTLTWTNGDISTKTFTVQTLRDNTVEGAKTVNLFLFNPQVAGNTNQNSQVLISPSNAVLTIQDTDSYGNLNFLVPNFNVFQNAGQALITVTRTGGTVGSVSVNFTTYTLTGVLSPYQAAVAGSNYSAVSTNLTFGPGVSSLSIAVPVYQTNETSAADRLVGLELFGGSPTNIAGQFPKTAVLTILDPKLHLNQAGSVDTTTQNGAGFDNYVNSLSLQPDASLLAGGQFSTFNGYPFGNAARLVPNGNFDTGFLFNLAGPNGTVWQVLSQTPATGQVDGNIMIVGDFTQVNEVNSPRIARLNLDGGLDTSFNPGAGADSTVYAIAQMSLPGSATNQTNLYYVIGGAFANYNGVAASGVVRVTPSGTFDANFNLGIGATGSNAAVHVLAVTAASQILAGGDFTSFNNQTHHHLVRLNVDGTLDTNFAAFDGVSSDINGSVRAMAVQPDGRILIGGLFTTVNGGNFNYIARLNSDGTTDTNFNVGTGCNNGVQAIAVDDQLRILVGGAFSRAGGVTRNGLTRFNPDGTVDPGINFGFGANGFVDTIVLQTNGEIDVAGGFSTFNNIPENNFVRLYGGANAGNGSVQFSQQLYGVLESGSNAVIGIQRIYGTFGSPSVSAVFSTSNNTALSGRDYVGVTNTVSFPPGETFETVSVPIIANFAVGPDLSLSLLLTNPPDNTEAIGPQVSATLIITNVNAGLEFSAQGYNQSATAGSMAVPVVRVGNPNTTVSVTVYTGTNGTAAPGVNYVPTTNTLVFYPGVTTNYWLITILNSPTTFQDTTVDLEMGNATNAIVASPASATLTINTALTGPWYVLFSQTNYTVSEGAGNAVITVLRTNGNQTVQVQLTTSDGTAVAGINYSNASALLTFTANQNVATDTIPIIQLTNAGPNTTVNLTLSNPTGGAVISGSAQEVLTIVNNIPSFSFGSATYFVNEGGGSVTLTILRSGPTNNAATVYYTTYSPTNASDTNGYAVPNVDYVPVSGTLTFPPGQTLETIPVTIIQGTNVNPVVSFQVLLQNPSAGTQIGTPGAATVGIIGNVSGFAFATNAYYVGENGSNIVITVNRLNPNTGSLSVHFATSDNTASGGVDYVATNGTLNFLNGQATNNITVHILNPNMVENNKTFNVTLSSPATNSYLVSPSAAVVTITNVYVGLAFGSPSFTVSECAVSAAIPVELTGLTNSTINVNAFTANGSGIAGVNYFSANTNLQFAPGQTVAYLYVTPINNHVIGPDHTVLLNLSNSFPVPSTVAGVQLLTPSTSVLTIQECNGAYIVASGTAFVNGTILPSTGVVYSNDTVTVLLGLRDIAGGNATNLIATLQLTNGITSNGIAGFVQSKNYGTLIQNGPTVSQPFTFTAIGSNGQNITAALALRDDANTNLGTVAFGFTIGGSTISFTNAATIFLPENATAPTTATNSIAPGYGYPSLISVSGIPGLITRATVTFSNFGHSFPSDVDAVLQGPNGSNSILMSHCGGSYGVGTVNGTSYGPPVTLTFDPTASVYMPLAAKLTNGTYLPTTNSLQMPRLPTVPTNVTVPVASPQSPYPYRANFSTFQGASPNGYWSLWAICDETLDSGYISNGWILNISTGVPVENDSDLEVTVNPVPAQATISNLLTYYLTVTNFGPSPATNVVITDYLPAGAVYVGNSCNCGVQTNGVLTVTLPLLAVGAGTAFDIAVTPTAYGYITNVVTALALEPDPNTNNMITNINLVGVPNADVGITLTGSPSPALVGGDVIFSVEVTNGGPSEALNVAATVALPSGFVPNTNGITPSTGTATNVNGTINWSLGSLLAGSEPTLTVAAKATTAGIGLCSASVSSSVYDPFKANNYAAVKIEVDQPLLSVVGATHSYQLAWDALATNYWLEGATNLPPQGTWIPIAATTVSNGQYIFSLPGTNGCHFFRLRAQVP